jgi:NAD(P)-dependent dehydrogenase (short-subunit alcohol dehydrogenase family)
MATSLNVLVTGSNTGFGRLFVETLAKAGHNVFAAMRGVTGKNATAATELRRFAEQNKLKLNVVEMVVTDDASCEQAVAKILGTDSHIDVVVNNAGTGTMGLSETFTSDQLRQLYDVNVLGPHRVNRAVLPSMRKRGKGLIVQISSGLGRLNIPALTVYGSSKFAIEALTEGYRYELAPLGIDVCIIQPGAFPTEFGSHSTFGSDTARAEGYGPVAQVPQQLGGHMAQMFSAPDGPKVEEVADALLKLINTPAGQRPFRTSVDRANAAAMAAINDACQNVQTAMFTHMGMKDLLGVKG